MRIVDVWLRLGGPEPRGRRSCAWWRGSKDLNIALHGERWYDHSRGTGGGPVELVAYVFDVRKLEAWRWLRAEGFIHGRLPVSDRRREEAIAEFQRGLAIRLENALAANKDLLWTLSDDDPERPAIARRVHEMTTLREQITRWPALLFSRAEKACPGALRSWRHVGRSDRQDAYALAIAAMRMIEIAEARKAAA